MRAELDTAQMAAMYEAGHSLASVAQACGVSDTTVRMRLAALGVTRRHRQPKTLAPDVRETIRDCKHTMTLARCADMHGVSVTTVGRIWNARCVG